MNAILTHQRESSVTSSAKAEINSARALSVSFYPVHSAGYNFASVYPIFIDLRPMYTAVYLLHKMSVKTGSMCEWCAVSVQRQITWFAIRLGLWAELRPQLNLLACLPDCWWNAALLDSLTTQLSNHRETQCAVGHTFKINRILFVRPQRPLCAARAKYRPKLIFYNWLMG